MLLKPSNVENVHRCLCSGFRFGMTSKSLNGGCRVTSKASRRRCRISARSRIRCPAPRFLKTAASKSGTTQLRAGSGSRVWRVRERTGLASILDDTLCARQTILPKALWRKQRRSWPSTSQRCGREIHSLGTLRAHRCWSRQSGLSSLACMAGRFACPQRGSRWRFRSIRTSPTRTCR